MFPRKEDKESTDNTLAQNMYHIVGLWLKLKIAALERTERYAVRFDVPDSWIPQIGCGLSTGGRSGKVQEHFALPFAKRVQDE